MKKEKSKKEKSKKEKNLDKKRRVRSKSMMKADRRLVSAVEVVKNKPYDLRGLTGRDAAFVTNILKGMSKVDAMVLASKAIGVEMTNHTAQVAADKTIQKPEVDSAIVSALEEVGVTDILVAEKMRQGLDAEAATQAGILYPDFRTRLGYIQTILKVKGQLGMDVVNKNQILNYTSFKGDDDAAD